MKSSLEDFFERHKIRMRKVAICLFILVLSLTACFEGHMRVIKAIYNNPNSEELLEVFDRIARKNGFVPETALVQTASHWPAWKARPYVRYDDILRKTFSLNINLEATSSQRTNVTITLGISGWDKVTGKRLNDLFETLAFDITSSIGETKFEVIERSRPK